MLFHAFHFKSYSPFVQCKVVNTYVCTISGWMKRSMHSFTMMTEPSSDNITEANTASTSHRWYPKVKFCVARWPSAHTYTRHVIKLQRNTIDALKLKPFIKINRKYVKMAIIMNVNEETESINMVYMLVWTEYLRRNSVKTIPSWCFPGVCRYGWWYSWWWWWWIRRAFFYLYSYLRRLNHERYVYAMRAVERKLLLQHLNKIIILQEIKWWLNFNTSMRQQQCIKNKTTLMVLLLQGHEKVENGAQGWKGLVCVWKVMVVKGRKGFMKRECLDRERWRSFCCSHPLGGCFWRERKYR